MNTNESQYHIPIEASQYISYNNRQAFKFKGASNEGQKCTNISNTFPLDAQHLPLSHNGSKSNQMMQAPDAQLIQH